MTLRPNEETSPSNALGVVRAVQGAEVEVSYRPPPGSPNVSGRVGTVGSLMIVVTSRNRLVGVVSSVRMAETTEAPLTATLQLIGSVREGLFSRGWEEGPALGDAVRVAEETDWKALGGGGAQEGWIALGSVVGQAAMPLVLDVNKLFSRHLLVVGNTGAGKSTTVATVISQVLERYPHGRIVVFDLHGEYGAIRHERVRSMAGRALRIPHWLLSLAQWRDLLNLEPAMIKSLDNLKSAITDLRMKFNPEFDRARLSVDTPIFYRMMELVTHPKVTNDDVLHERLTRLDKDVRYDLLLKSGYEQADGLAPFASWLMPVEAGCTVLDLSEVVPDLISPVVEICSRVLFELAYWNRQRDAPLLLVFEEAHRYLSDEYPNRASKKRVENIVKEGRKYGVSVMVVTQRPADIAETILAQCNTVVAHRLTTERDRAVIKTLVPEHLAGMIAALPALETGEVFCAGEAVPFPMRGRIQKAHTLASTDVDYHAKWRQGPSGGFSANAALEAWMHQGASSPPTS